MTNGSTKYILLVGDGMADYPIPELGGKTPLEASNTPNMDLIANCRVGSVKTIADGMEPGSDVANLALLGYDPLVFHTGRAPFEAGSMGVRLKPSEVAFRMNLVTLDFRPQGEVIMVSHSSGDITTEEARHIVEDLKRQLIIPGVQIYSGVAYRHLLVWDKGPLGAVTIPPHDVLDQDMAGYLNTEDNDPVKKIIHSSWDLLKAHHVNVERKNKGLKEANSIWLWGQGKAPELPLFKEKFGLRAGVISAVDLIKGIGFFAGFEYIKVDGATGYLNTNYIGKAQGALDALKDLDFMFVHVEAPDEASHNGNIKEKIQAIEYFDERLVGTVLKGLEEFHDYRIMIASDHFTPISLKTHSREPAPFAWASKKELGSRKPGPGFSEKAANQSGILFEKGHDLMPAFLETR
ncbi:putative 2,3-bisphosphoglycerate-independent phosphoglycerate mutase [uncultured Desulfobacterium sp.]|uniref:Putative 2,3-bisphosphoglycerate-independent phosphoglycerate mutase n=1 Tax=uncultured Desulfobacterium sp. TaxID=201089 RepID=A0A445N0C2_9BACT|nr:putative 2,3-bisphosphoglycerate-independent phosphoglycerate mutase [uncultured Desulfobacterium sp.]